MSGENILLKKYLEKYYLKKIIENVILLKVYTNPHIGTNAFILWGNCKCNYLIHYWPSGSFLASCFGHVMDY